MFKKHIAICAILILSNQVYAQSSSVTGATKATATLAAVCTIAAQNVNFGQINLPISNQSATSSMNVQCTKGSSYTIGLAYGGIYGQTATPSTSYYKYGSTTYVALQGYQSTYYLYSSAGKLLLTSKVSGQKSDTALASLGYGTVDPANGYYYPTGTTFSYAYGKMIGVMSGDAIGYAIQVPNNPGQVWNTGNYSYTTTGTGSNQSIPVVATIQSANTTELYPTADTYIDIVTATITY